MPNTTLKELLEKAKGGSPDYYAALAAARRYMHTLTEEQFEEELFKIESWELIGRLMAAGVRQPYFDVFTRYLKERI